MDDTKARDEAIDREIEALQRMTIRELRAKHVELFGEPSRSANRDFLWRRLAWRVQELAYGGISERARRRAAEIANDADLRIRPPRGFFDRKEEAPAGSPGPTLRVTFDSPRSRLPIPGTLITRVYRGRRLDVHVREKGFEFEGKLYSSLTAIANEVTGSHWNGYDFFKVPRAGAKEKPRGAGDEPAAARPEPRA